MHKLGSRGRPLLLVVGGLAVLLAAAVGSVSAKPGYNLPDQQGKLPPMKQKLDAVWTKGLTPKLPGSKVLVTPAAAAAARDQTMKVPTFAIKKLTPEERGTVLGATPPAIQGPLLFNARSMFYDDDHYLELLAVPPSYVHVRTKRNYLYFNGSSAESLPDYAGAWGELHFMAAPRTRYLLECAVEAGPMMMISATDDRAQYLVSTSDRATLLYRRDNETTTPDPVVVRLGANYNQWYLDGCELSWTPMP